MADEQAETTEPVIETTLLTEGQPPPVAETLQGWSGFADDKGNFAEKWQEKLPEDLGAARDAVAKYKSLPEMVKGLHEAQQMIGRKANAVEIPGKDAKPEVVSAYRKAMGVPEKIEDYQFKPDKLPDGVEWIDDYYKPIAEIAHRNGVSPAVMKEIATAHAQLEGAKASVDLAQSNKQVEDAKAELRGLWGDKYPEQINRATQVAKMGGLDINHPAMRSPDVVKFLSSIASKFSDDTFMAGNEGGGSGGKALANQIMTAGSNPNSPHYDTYQKYAKGDPATVDYVTRLLKAG